MSTITTALYQQDFYGWIQHHIQLLQQGRLSEIDVNLLIEELESMADHDRHELENHFIMLIAHLLKWEYQQKQLTELWQTWKGGSWRSSIIEQRKQISRQLRKRPSLKPYLTAAKVSSPAFLFTGSPDWRLQPVKYLLPKYLNIIYELRRPILIDNLHLWPSY